MIFFGLDLAGFILAIILGTIVYIYGGGSYLLLLLSFLFLSLYITSIHYREKAKIGVYDYKRGWPNVLSNGLVPTILAMMSSIWGPFPYIVSVAAITADKFASELGVLVERPIELFTWKKVKAGKSGAISSFGTFASFVGALSISFLSVFLFGITAKEAIIAAVLGTLGAFADSIAGYFEERGLGNKETSNIICSLIGGALAILILYYKFL